MEIVAARVRMKCTGGAADDMHEDDDETARLAGLQVNTTNLERMRKVKTRHQQALPAGRDGSGSAAEAFLDNNDVMTELAGLQVKTTNLERPRAR